MKALLHYFSKNSFIVNMICLMILVGGGVSLTTIKRDLIPEWRFNNVSVYVGLPGASSEEMEKLVVFPIEESLKSLSSLKTMKSQISEGSARIELKYPADYKKLDESLVTIESRINSLRTQLPTGIEYINVQKDIVDSVFFMSLALEGFDDGDEKHVSAFEALKLKLNALPGIIGVSSEIPKPNVLIDFSKEKLERFGVSVAEVKSKIKMALRFTPVGQRIDDGDRIQIELSRPVGSLEGVENIPIRVTATGPVILLKDVAEVRLAPEDRKTWSYVNGQSGTYLRLTKDISFDTIRLKKKTNEFLESYQEETVLPFGVSVQVDGPRFIETQIEVLMKNGWIGFILVFLMIWYFLGFKVSIMTVFGLPLAYFGNNNYSSAYGSFH